MDKNKLYELFMDEVSQIIWEMDGPKPEEKLSMIEGMLRMICAIDEESNMKLRWTTIER